MPRYNIDAMRIKSYVKPSTSSVTMEDKSAKTIEQGFAFDPNSDIPDIPLDGSKRNSVA